MLSNNFIRKLQGKSVSKQELGKRLQYVHTLASKSGPWNASALLYSSKNPTPNTLSSGKTKLERGKRAQNLDTQKFISLMN